MCSSDLEKIRWTLDASDVPYVERAWTPFFHVPSALRRGRRTTVPIVETPSEAVQDSTRILAWLERRGSLPLLPSETAAREEVMRVEDQFDKVGEHVVRFAYSAALAHRDTIVGVWSLDATPTQRAFLGATYPALRAGFQRLVGTTPEKVERSRTKIDAGLRFVEERVASGARYLVGDRFSVADVTAAALLAPIAMPDEHPVYSRDDYREGLRALMAPWRERPALEWVRRTYREHRGFGRMRRAG